MQVQVLRVKFILLESILRATIEEKGKRNCLVEKALVILSYGFWVSLGLIVCYYTFLCLELILVAL